MNVLDASAVLAFLQGEEGADEVEAQLEAEVCCSTANWSEVVQKLIAHGRDWELSRSLLASYDLVFEPVTEADATWAAERWQRHEGLSLGDRLCLALGQRLDALVWTADRHWGSSEQIRQIR